MHWVILHLWLCVAICIPSPYFNMQLRFHAFRLWSEFQQWSGFQQGVILNFLIAIVMKLVVKYAVFLYRTFAVFVAYVLFAMFVFRIKKLCPKKRDDSLDWLLDELSDAEDDAEGDDAEDGNESPVTSPSWGHDTSEDESHS